MHNDFIYSKIEYLALDWFRIHLNGIVLPLLCQEALGVRLGRSAADPGVTRLPKNA